MTDTAIYKDIASRTDGCIYIGVVGPVRTGKSTLIKRFMEGLVLPNIQNDYTRERSRDELPQSASGRTVMTTEPKFVPDEAVTVDLGENSSFKVKLIDCVGYLVKGAAGHTEDGAPRMVMTPWSEEGLPFEAAAELGTKKVISEHSTIGLLVTTDGTVCDIPRESYVAAEKRVASELKALGKPFTVVLNTANPDSAQAKALAAELKEEYGTEVTAVNCLEMTEEDIRRILKSVLYEFPVRELRIFMPPWVSVLEENHPLRSELYSRINECASAVEKVGDVKRVFKDFKAGETEISATATGLDLGEGIGRVEIKVPDRLFYAILGENSGFEIKDEKSLVKVINELSVMKKSYDKVSAAIKEVNEKGYGIVTPSIEDMRLEEPRIVKQPGGYGVRLKASAPSIHMIKANIETEVSPTVGSERQSEELCKFLLKEFEEDPTKIWETNMFGKTLHELVGEGLNTKLSHMPDEARNKLSETLQKIINEGSGGLICILL